MNGVSAAGPSRQETDQAQVSRSRGGPSLPRKEYTPLSFQQVNRSRSPSIKRSAEQAELQSQVPQETPWSTVAGRNQGRRQRTVQYGTAKVPVTARGEAAPYSVVLTQNIQRK